MNQFLINFNNIFNGNRDIQSLKMPYHLNKMFQKLFISSCTFNIHDITFFYRNVSGSVLLQRPRNYYRFNIQRFPVPNKLESQNLSTLSPDTSKRVGKDGQIKWKKGCIRDERAVVQNIFATFNTKQTKNMRVIPTLTLILSVISLL